MKCLSGIQYKAEECKRQVTTTQQAQVITFQLREVTQASAGRKYILTIPDTQPISTQAVQPSQVATPQPLTVIWKVQPQKIRKFYLQGKRKINNKYHIKHLIP